MVYQNRTDAKASVLFWDARRGENPKGQNGPVNYKLTTTTMAAQSKEMVCWVVRSYYLSVQKLDIRSKKKYRRTTRPVIRGKPGQENKFGLFTSPI